MANHVISGQAYWSHVIRPNTKFNPDGEYSIEIYIIQMCYRLIFTCMDSRVQT